MFFTLDLFYLAMKLFFFYSIVKVFLKFDNMRDHKILLALFYTLGVAALSWVWMLAPRFQTLTPNQVSELYQGWGKWLAMNAGLTYIYFRLLDRFDEGVLFFIVLVLGLGVVYF